MSNKVGSEWDDERIDAAYRGLAASGSARGLAESLRSAVEGEGSRRGSSWRTAGAAGPVRALAGLAAAVAVVTLIGATLIIRGGQPADGGGHSAGQSAETSIRPDGFPVAVENLTVMSVADAIEASGSGTLTEADLLAVGGWLHALPPVMACPTVSANSALEGWCGATDLPLSDTRDAGGPSMIARAIEIDLGPKLPVAADPPVRAVLVGHFNDLRATLCVVADQAACRKQFVVDQVAWLDGKTLPASIVAVSANSHPMPSPHLTPDAVMAALKSSLAPDDVVISMTAASLIDWVQSFTLGMAPSGDGSWIYWRVRLAGAPPSNPPMVAAHAGSGWIVVEDATGRIRQAGGWGWDPSKAGIALPNGEVSVVTTNSLAGGACAGVGLDAVLRGAANDKRVAWLENHMGGGDLAIVWPAGYRARFTPTLEILDEHGSVVLRDGDPVTGACGTANGSVYLEPPFK